MSRLPRWRNLNHFNQVMGIKFTDASKYEDISKVLMHVTHLIFPLNAIRLAHSFCHAQFN